MTFGELPRWGVAIADENEVNVKRAKGAANAHDPTCEACQ